MVGQVYSAAVIGIEASLILVEADVSAGIPSFDTSGNLSPTVREARERVRTALRNSNFKLTPSKITINMIPANIRKEGSHYDLAMAVSIMISAGIILKEDTEGMAFAGELSLDGRVCPVKAALPIVLAAKNGGCTSCCVPYDNIKEASMVSDINIMGVRNLEECVLYLKSRNKPYISSNGFKNTPHEFNIDFSQIKGQESVKRAVMIAAASMHNILMVGPPGSGKSMIASRIPTILPLPDFDELLRITAAYSVAGLLKDNSGIMEERPFRAPHHSISLAAFTGGGAIPVPGEMSLADSGVLFMDEFNLFSEEVIDSMRIPLEKHIIHIDRISGRYTFPADYMLVAAMNPCKCGYYPDRTRCSCRERDIERYFNKISSPIMDRIDMCIRVNKSTYSDIVSDDTGYSSLQMQDKVKKACEIQKERYKGTGIRFNSRLDSHMIHKYCIMDNKAQSLIRLYYEKSDLTPRGYYRIIKVARTIADIDGSENIEEGHIYEAIGYKLM